MQLVFYVSGHGFGHASRDIELMNAIAAERADARFVVRTAVTPWLFESALAPLTVQFCETDTGVVQIDSLRLDEDATVRRAADFYREWDRRVASEAAFLKGTGADVVLGDIPPLAFAAAAEAGVASIAVGNFTWDWIYEHYQSFDARAPEVLPIIRRAYATTTRALRLPLHGGFEPMAAVTRDVPFIARRSSRDPDETRDRLGVPDGTRLVLVSFGAYGVELPLEEIGRANPFTVVSFDRSPAGLRYPDIVAAADVVVSKPGYGIVSECAAHDTPLLYTSRGRFVEYDVFVEEMPRVLRCRYLPPEDLFTGRWADAIEALLRQPPPPERPRIDGATSVAAEILDRVIGKSGRWEIGEGESVNRESGEWKDRAVGASQLPDPEGT